MTTIFKRRDLIPEASNITGLLIVNHDIDTHPMKRPRLYSGDLEEIAQGAKEQGIGLPSTVELYKIALAAKDGKLSKEKARKIIKQQEGSSLTIETPQPCNFAILKLSTHVIVAID